MPQNPACPKCNSSKIVKNGRVRDKQRYKCKDCNYTYTNIKKILYDKIADISSFFIMALRCSDNRTWEINHDIKQIANAIGIDYRTLERRSIKTKEFENIFEEYIEVKKNNTTKSMDINILYGDIRLSFSIANYNTRLYYDLSM